MSANTEVTFPEMSIREAVLERYRGDYEFVRELVPLFRRCAAETLRMLHGAASAGDWRALDYLSLSLRKTAAGVEARGLMQAAEELHLLAASQRRSELPRALAAIGRCIEESDRGLSVFLEAGDSSGSGRP